MSHRTLRIVAGIVFAGLLLAVPALADHIQEPTRPIIQDGSGVNVFPYPFAGLAIQDCLDGGETFRGKDFARVEGIVRAEPNWPDRSAPSEHYVVHYEVAVTAHFVQPNGQVNVRLAKRSGGFWPHQNVGPHERNPWGFVQWNEWLMPNGPVSIDFRLVGAESGNTVQFGCDFVVVDSPVRDVYVDVVR